MRLAKLLIKWGATRTLLFNNCFASTFIPSNSLTGHSTALVFASVVSVTG